MGLFGTNENSNQPRSLWSRLIKNRKQKSTPGDSFPNQFLGRHSQHSQQPPFPRPSEDFIANNFRPSIQSPREGPLGHHGSPTRPEQLDFRLRTSKLQCEQLKKKVATISLECSRLESQCRDLGEVKEKILSSQRDIAMLKRKDKVQSEIQQKLTHLEEENFSMADQIEHLRGKLEDLETEMSPDLINQRLEQVEADSQKLTAITLKNRRDHDRFSLEVGNQLVETFVTQQTICEEFRRLQHRLVSVERQNQIMSDLIHFHCQRSNIVGQGALISLSCSSQAGVSLLASGGIASSSFSPPSSDRDAGRTSPSNNDWHFTDQDDSLILCDTLHKSLSRLVENPSKTNYYKIDFTPESDTLRSLHDANLSVEMSTSAASTEGVAFPDKCQTQIDAMSSQEVSLFDHGKSERKKISSTASHSRDDGYYSTSQDGTLLTERSATYNKKWIKGVVTVFQDDKMRYLFLNKHIQKSKGRTTRSLLSAESRFQLVIKSSMDLESHQLNRHLRDIQQRQREVQADSEENSTQVFSDTELYGTRFCIDSDIEDEDDPVILHVNKMKPLKRNFGYCPPKHSKAEHKHVSNLPPLIEHVSERERKIEIKSSRKSRIVPPRVHPKVSYTPESPEPALSPMRQALAIKPPKVIPSIKASKVKTIDPPKILTTSLYSKRSHAKKESEKPPPIPPRPKKNLDGAPPTAQHKTLVALDYVNDPTTRMSPEVCQALHKPNKCRNFNSKVTWDKSYSPDLEDCYIEDDDESKMIRSDHYDQFYDQRFISELESYQLPKSSVDILVMKNFK